MEANKFKKISEFLLLSIFLIFLYSCNKGKGINIKSTNEYSKTTHYTAIIEDSIIYDFLNNGLLKENENYRKCNYIVESYPSVDIEDIDGSETLIPKIDSLFTKEDLNFIRKQYENGTYFKIDSAKIKNKILISLEAYHRFAKDENIYNEVPKDYPCILSIKVPVFNIEKNKAVIWVEYFCGFQCGEYGLYLYEENESNQWEFITTLWEEQS